MSKRYRSLLTDDDDKVGDDDAPFCTLKSSPLMCRAPGAPGFPPFPSLSLMHAWLRGKQQFVAFFLCSRQGKETVGHSVGQKPSTRKERRQKERRKERRKRERKKEEERRQKSGSSSTLFFWFAPAAPPPTFSYLLLLSRSTFRSLGLLT